MRSYSFCSEYYQLTGLIFFYQPVLLYIQTHPLLTDIEMSDISGDELARTIHARYTELPVVAITSSREMSSIDRSTHCKKHSIYSPTFYHQHRPILARCSLFRSIDDQDTRYKSARQDVL